MFSDYERMKCEQDVQRVSLRTGGHKIIECLVTSVLGIIVTLDMTQKIRNSQLYLSQ